ncbi:MAG: sigma-54-dependent Fis family transcriptional regulator [Planctomycetaceae bacterium]|nr:sigma-54-dependent Fis family transcriptional regulator [Planctomycetaceae bacterium]
MGKILVVDDDRSTLHLIEHSLSKADAGLEIVTARSAEEGLARARESRPDVVLLDIMLPGASGLEVFQQFQEIERHLPVIYMTSGAGSHTAIEAIERGAFDYLAKPLRLTQLNEQILKALEFRRMMKVPVALSASEASGSDADLFVGRSPQMLEVFKSIGRVAKQNVTVLVRGESGSGKELVARALYQHSDRANKPFMAVNCAALPDTLLESELFGHEKGAFTGADRRRIGKFEQCNGGTIFLDEVGDMSALVQGKVLRLLQEQRFERVGGNETIATDVRLVAATNRPLEDMVEAGTFRADLLYRLNGVTIHILPLRERVEDIPLLLQYFLNRTRTELNKLEIKGISPEALEILQSYAWPGNVRELHSVVRQAVLKATGPVIIPDMLPAEVLGKPVTRSREPAASGLPDADLQGFIEQRLQCESTNLYAETLEMMERYLLTRVLRQTEGNQKQASEILGITRGKVRDRIAAFEISLDRTVGIREE